MYLPQGPYIRYRDGHISVYCCCKHSSKEPELAVHHQMNRKWLWGNINLGFYAAVRENEVIGCPYDFGVKCSLCKSDDLSWDLTHIKVDRVAYVRNPSTPRTRETGEWVV